MCGRSRALPRIHLSRRGGTRTIRRQPNVGRNALRPRRLPPGVRKPDRRRGRDQALRPKTLSLLPQLAPPRSRHSDFHHELTPLPNPPRMNPCVTASEVLMRLRPILLLAALSLLPYFVNAQQGQGLRKPTAEQISTEITRLSLRRVYVSDFLDSSGQRTAPGAYFAAAFSKLLRQPARDFTIISRFNAHKFL